MTHFQDSKGTNWALNLTIGAVKRVRKLTQHDLTDIASGEPPLLTRLGMDIVSLIDVIWAIVEPEATSQGITDEQFGERLGGNSLVAAADAFYKELVNFFQSLGRMDLALMVSKQKTLIEKAVAATAARVDGVDLDALVVEFEKSRFGKPSTNFPEQSESIPIQ